MKSTSGVFYNKYMLFGGREVRIEKNCARGRGAYRDRGHNFNHYGPPGRQITFFLFFYLFLLKLLSALLVTNLLLSAGGQDGKIPPAQETNQITGFFLSCPLVRLKKQ